MTKIRLMNQVRIKMKRRKLSTRFFQVDSSDNQTTCDVIDPMFQIVIVTVVLTLFLYFIFQAGLDRTTTPLPDFSWLSTRNVSAFLRPEERTALKEPEPSPCSAPDTQIRILVAVFSAPRNSLARATIRKTWGKKMREYPGVKLVFMLGRDADSVQHVSDFLLKKFLMRNSLKS